MLRILQFLYKLRAFLLFILLEGMAIWLIVENNSPQGAAFFNSSSAVIGSALKTQSDIVDFFSLAEANEALVVENANLLEALKGLKAVPDSLSFELDSALSTSYEFKGARVVSNSIRFSQNHLTLDKGSKDGIKPGMGVFNQEGVVGRVKSVSSNYAVVISLLNTGMLVSSKIKSIGNFGTISWDGKNSRQVKLLYIPRHVNAQVGDTIITSGYNAVFPEGISIGVISEVNNDQNNPNYLDILIDLSVDFSKVSYVYLVENTLFEELDSLSKTSELTNEY